MKKHLNVKKKKEKTISTITFQIKSKITTWANFGVNQGKMNSLLEQSQNFSEEVKLRETQ